MLRERFDEDLPDRGPEDSDLSYRLSRHGMILIRLDAHIHHVGSPTGRGPSSLRSQVDAIGPLMLHRKHSTDRERSRRLSRQLLRRRALIGLAKDLRFKRWSLPTFRGFAAGLRAVDPLLGKSDEVSRRWYEEWKRKVQ